MKRDTGYMSWLDLWYSFFTLRLEDMSLSSFCCKKNMNREQKTIVTALFLVEQSSYLMKYLFDIMLVFLKRIYT